MVSLDLTLDIYNRVISDLLDKVILKKSGLFSIEKKKAK